MKKSFFLSYVIVALLLATNMLSANNCTVTIDECSSTIIATSNTDCSNYEASEKKCETSLSIAESLDVSDGCVHFFDGINFEYHFLKVRATDCSYNIGANDNKLSSIAIPPGYGVWLYEYPDLEGDAIYVSGLRSSLPCHWNNRVSSFHIVYE